MIARGMTFPVTLDSGREVLLEDVMMAAHIISLDARKRRRDARKWSDLSRGVYERVRGETIASVSKLWGVSEARGGQLLRKVWRKAVGLSDPSYFARKRRERRQAEDAQALRAAVAYANRPRTVPYQPQPLPRANFDDLDMDAWAARYSGLWPEN